MRTPLSVANLIHFRWRTIVGVLGVAFAVILVFMQLGFLGTLRTTATILYDRLDFDICIWSKEYQQASLPASFPRTHLALAESVDGVEAAYPFYLGMTKWRVPSYAPRAGQEHGILVYAARPTDAVFGDPDLQAKLHALTVPDMALIDSTTRSEFGPRDGRRFGPDDAGLVTEVGGKRLRIEGTFKLGIGFTASGNLLTSERGFHRLFPNPGHGKDHVNLVFAKVKPAYKQSKADLQRVVDEVAARMPPDVVVLSREETLRRERKRWIDETSFGVIFWIGVVVATVIGSVVVYQVLSSDVAALMGEYATLKAMGYSTAYLARVVLEQSLIIAILGYLIGLAAAPVLYWITATVAQVPVGLDWRDVVLVAAGAVGICLVSGFLTALKLRQADPASLLS